MRKYFVVLSLAVVALLCLAPRPAHALTCAQCEVILGDWDNLDLKLDFNGNGFSTYDKLVVRKLQVYGEVDYIDQGILAGLIGTDVTGDGVYNGDDYAVIYALSQFLYAGSLTGLDLDDFQECSGYYVLASCP